MMVFLIVFFNLLSQPYMRNYGEIFPFFVTAERAIVTLVQVPHDEWFV